MSTKSLIKNGVSLLIAVCLFDYLVIPLFIMFAYGAGSSGYESYESSVWPIVFQVFPWMLFGLLTLKSLRKNQKDKFELKFILWYILGFFIVLCRKVILTGIINLFMYLFD